MTAAVSLLPSAGTSRPSAPSLGLLTGIEVRKSLSTRSGKAVAAVAMAVGPIGTLLVSLDAEGTAPGAGIVGITGMLTAFVLLALGVLSTAGEWTHQSVQTTYLLVPQRLRVLSAKVLALALQGAAFAAVGAGLTLAMMAVVGAGVGAALGNSPAALTGTYLVILGVMPVLQAFKPDIAEKLDPASSIVNLAMVGIERTPVLVIAGWVVGSVAVGAFVTGRRSVQ